MQMAAQSVLLMDLVAVAINYYQVAADAQEKGWTLVSDSYKNLKSPLEYICPKGHIVNISYEDWRKNPQCPQCHQELHGNAVRNKMPPKQDGVKRVLSLDAATKTTGWAVYDNSKLVAYGTYTAADSDPAIRINQVKKWLDNSYSILQPDLIGIENIQLEKGNVKTFQVLANLQGVLIDYCLEHNIRYCLAYPATWRAYLGINHNEEREEAKRSAQQWVKLMCDIKATQDEADAIAMGKYFYNELKKSTSVSWGEKI